MAGVEKRDFELSRMRVGRPTRRGWTSFIWAARRPPASRWSLGGSSSMSCGPVAGTDSCQHRHLGVVQSGNMRVTHDDGTVLELGPGDAYVIEPGHDAEIIGGERFVGFEFQPKAAEEYARWPPADRRDRLLEMIRDRGPGTTGVRGSRPQEPRPGGTTGSRRAEPPARPVPRSRFHASRWVLSLRPPQIAQTGHDAGSISRGLHPSPCTNDNGVPANGGRPPFRSPWGATLRAAAASLIRRWP